MPITIASKLSLVVKKTVHPNHMDLNPAGILKENLTSVMVVKESKFKFKIIRQKKFTMLKSH
jgi:hypothetical protein